MNEQPNTKELIERLMAIGRKAQFASLTYRAKETGELARHTIILGSDYDKRIEQSLVQLESLTLATMYDILAAKDLENSFKTSLEFHAKGQFNPDYTKPETYVPIANGLKFYVRGGTMNVSGLQQKKVVIEPGTYKARNRSPLVEAKDKLRKELPIGKWREFIVRYDHLLKAKLQGVELVLP